MRSFRISDQNISISRRTSSFTVPVRIFQRCLIGNIGTKYPAPGYLASDKRLQYQEEGRCNSAHITSL